MNKYHYISGKAQVGPIIGIIVALALIIGAVTTQSGSIPVGAVELNVPPITEADHVRGNIDAPVYVIEYSDLECPFCKNFHQTMQQIYSEFGESNQIAWVYRHYPLVQRHKKARGEAIASECVAKTAPEGKGSESFWKFIDEVFAITPANDGLDLSILPTLAERSGANKAEFIKCYNNAETAAKVDSDMEGGSSVGAEGTPYTLIISPNGKVNNYAFTINGAYPYEEVKATIEKALADK